MNNNNIKSESIRGFVVAGNGHLTDDGQDVIVDVIVGDEDVTDAPAPAVVVAVFLPVAVIVHQHLIARPLIEERNLELEGVDIMLVIGDLVEIDGHVTVDGDVTIVIMIIIVRLLLILGSSVRKEGQIPSRLLPVGLKIRKF